jgi:hypothetical protein
MKNQIIIVFGVFYLMVLSSCKKEGCTDAIATNFNEEASKDDGSCTYDATVNFWYNQATSQNLQNDEIISLTVYVDNQVIGSYASNVFFNGSPSCGQSSLVSKSLDLGKAKTKTANYRVIDDIGDEIWSGTATFDASVECTSYELTY